MKISFDSLCVLAFVCVVTVLSAPAKKNSESVPSASKIQQQEQELERLAKLAAQRLSHGIGVQKQKSFHYSNLNGDESSESQTEEKVVNPETGDVVSDIKQDTKQDGGEPMTKTKVEIPSANIDQTFVESKPTIDEDKAENTYYSEAFQFTPADVAKYLYQTGNFGELSQALSDLVNASIMTEKQAVEYKNNVRTAYNQLVQATAYTDTNEIPLYNVPYEQSENMLSADVLPAYNYYNELLPYGSPDEQNVDQESEVGNGISDLVNTLMDEWLTRTVLTGDREAETMLSAIWDNISQDDNPDDLGQMRDILVDIFTSEIIEGLTSDVQEELPYYSDLLPSNESEEPIKIDTEPAKDQQDSENETNDMEQKTEDNDEHEQEKIEMKTEDDLKHLKM